MKTKSNRRGRRQRGYRGLLWVLAAGLLLFGLIAQQNILLGTSSRHALLMDARTGQVLARKRSGEEAAPASLTKMMTVPLAEQLNVTVAELLQGCRVEEEQRFTREETEELIRKALIFSAEPPERRQARTQKFLPLYGVSVVLGLVETAAVWAVGLAGTEGAMTLLIINVIFGIVYGAYTLFWMPETLPRYYDENHVCNFAQGAFHMHIPGVYYNNRNWLHVIKAMRVWCVVSMLLTPLCTAAAVVFEQATGWQVWGAVLIGYIASLFGAIVIPAKKYQ